MTRCMKKSFLKQALPPRKSSHLRHVHKWICSSSRTTHSIPLRTKRPDRQIMIKNNSQDWARNNVLSRSNTHLQSSAANVSWHIRVYHLSRTSDSRAITMKDLPSPEIRSSQSSAKQRGRPPVSINSCPIEGSLTVQLKAKPLYRVSSKCNFLTIVASRASSLRASSLGISLLVNDGCIETLYFSNLLCSFFCRISVSSAQRLTLIPQHPPFPSHQLPSFIAPPFLHSPLCSASRGPFIMAEQPGQQNPQEPNINIDRLFSKDCTMCKTHTFMINRLRSQLKELKEDYESDNRSKRKKLEKQKVEIENLKGRCSHLEEAIEQIRALTQSFQAEASTKASGARKEPLPDVSVTQKTPYGL